jgi:pantetheine-phosphate adenylyltransferase
MKFQSYLEFINESKKVSGIDVQEILNRWKVDIKMSEVINDWSESHRSYHDLSHLEDLLKMINKLKSKVNHEQFEALVLVAIFHDIVYHPFAKDNEEQSALYFMKRVKDRSNPMIQKINQAILDTKTHIASNELSVIFNDLDMDVFNRNYSGLLKWENGVYNEYKSVGNDKYREGRVQFLQSQLDNYPKNRKNLLRLIDYVNNEYK